MEGEAEGRKFGGGGGWVESPCYHQGGGRYVSESPCYIITWLNRLADKATDFRSV